MPSTSTEKRIEQHVADGAARAEAWGMSALGVAQSVRATFLSCPRCAVALSQMPFGDGVFCGCTRCGGAWVDSRGCGAILEGAVDTFTALASQLESVAYVRVDPRAPAQCPVCTMELGAGTLPPNDTLLHTCATHGTWFDRGALSAVAGARRLESPTVAVGAWVARQGESDWAAATIPSRIIATVIDTVVAFLCFAVPADLCFQLAGGGVLPTGLSGFLSMVILGVCFSLALGIGQAAGLAWKGQTLGKYLEGIRVVRLDGERAGFWRAVVLRSMVLPLAAAFGDAAAAEFDGALGIAALGVAGLINLAVSADPWLAVLPARRTLHDYIAGTKVIVLPDPRFKRTVRIVLGTLGVFAALGVVVLVLSKC
jgi:uncharacterized RDD family membrane protein YckC/Zn-finger nucleic acid-binding protein